MKNQFIKVLIPPLLMMGATAYGDLQCQALDGSGNKVPMSLTVYFGKGPNGSDVTTITTPTAKNQFFDTYHTRASRAGNGLTSASLTSYEGGAHNVGSVYLSFDSDGGAAEGSIHLLSKTGESEFDLSCTPIAQSPKPKPTPFLPPPNHPCPRC